MTKWVDDELDIFSDSGGHRVDGSTQDVCELIFLQSISYFKRNTSAA